MVNINLRKLSLSTTSAFLSPLFDWKCISGTCEDGFLLSIGLYSHVSFDRASLSSFRPIELGERRRVGDGDLFFCPTLNDSVEFDIIVLVFVGGYFSNPISPFNWVFSSTESCPKLEIFVENNRAVVLCCRS